MAACCSHQQPTLGCRLALHISEIRVGQHLTQQPLGLEGFDRSHTVEMCSDFQQMVGRVDHQSRGQAGFLGIGSRYQQGTPGLAGRERRRQHALNRPQ